MCACKNSPTNRSFSSWATNMERLARNPLFHQSCGLSTHLIKTQSNNVTLLGTSKMLSACKKMIRYVPSLFYYWGKWGNSIISKCKGRRSVRGRSRHHLKQLSFIWKSPESVERERSQIVWCHETRTSPAIFELHSICTPKWNYSIIMLSSNQRHCRIYGNHSLPSYPGSHPCDGSHEHRCG